MLKTIGIRAPNCWTNHDEPIIGSIKQPPSLRCSDAGLSDAGADDDGQKGQELMGVERSVWDVPCWMAFWCLLIDLHYMFPEIVDMDHVVVSWLVQFGLNLIHFEASHIIPNHTQNSKPYPNPPNHLKRCKILYNPLRCILLWREELDVDDFMWKHAVEDCENARKSSADWDGSGQSHWLSITTGGSNLGNPQATEFWPMTHSQVPSGKLT